MSKSLDNQIIICPKCGYNGGKGFFGHQKQLNLDNPNDWVCGSCSCAFSIPNTMMAKQKCNHITIHVDIHGKKTCMECKKKFEFDEI